MKKSISLSAMLLLGTMSAFGSHSRYQSQFSVPRATTFARAHAQAQVKGNPKNPAVAAHQPQKQISKTSKSHTAVSNSQNSQVTSLGFVTAKQIPAGGAAYKQAYMGDFNGDGKKDVVTVVRNYVNGSDVYSISAVLNNGNGSFKPAVLTTVLTQDPILVADLNGDGKDDIVQVHPGSTPSTVDVWLSNGDGTFKAGNSYQISTSSLRGGLLTDVNGDGKMDLMAIDSQTPGLVRTLLGNGDGTFQAATSVTLASQAPTDLIFADFNGDGIVDFAGISNGQVVVYLQEGGNFILTGSPLVSSDGQYGICGMGAADLNGDSKAEIVTVNCDSSDDNTITIYVNNGDGTFATGVYYADAASGGTSPADLYPEALTIADVNGDGKADIVLTNYYGSDITILLGNGDGTVKVPNTGYATGGYPQSPALVADFNGDGLVDIMQIDDVFSYAYLQGYGDGTFRAALDYYTPINDSGWPYSVTIATGDFNGDGIKDFVVGSYDWNSVQTGITVFLSRGDGSLRPGVNYGTESYLESVAVADFDGDGHLDVAATSWNSASVQLFHGNGDGTFTVGSTYATGAGGYSCPYGLVTGDFNHDQHTDIAVVNENCGEGSNNVGVLLNDGTGGFLTAVSYNLSNWAWSIAAGDINNDGYTDLLIPLENSNQVAVMLANSDNSGTFQAETDVALVNGNASYNNPQFITLGDFNNDGKLDFAVTIDGGSNVQGIAVALGKGDGTFQTPSLYSTTNKNFQNFNWPYPAAVQSADINGDGILDLVYTNSNYSTVGVLLGNGNGTFGLPMEYPAGGYAYGIAIADINGDGALDVVTADDDAGEVTVLLNANGSTQRPDYSVSSSVTTNTVIAGASASYTVMLTGKNGYNGTVDLSCSGLPAKATCSFSPASIAVAGNAGQGTSLDITTVARTSAALVQPTRPNSNSGVTPLLASIGGLGLLGFVFGASAKNPNRRQMMIIFGILLLMMTFTLVGCGNSTPSSMPVVTGTPAGNYTVTVTATGTGSTAPTHTVNLTLVVQ
jgi:hypothetical protein